MDCRAWKGSGVQAGGGVPRALAPKFPLACRLACGGLGEGSFSLARLCFRGLLVERRKGGRPLWGGVGQFDGVCCWEEEGCPRYGTLPSLDLPFRGGVWNWEAGVAWETAVALLALLAQLILRAGQQASQGAQ